MPPKPSPAIGAILAKLERYPHLQFQHTDTSITITPEDPDGFPVRLEDCGGHFVVGLGGWHEHFTSESEALNCFAFGLSEECRLRVTSRGSFDYRWTVQHFVDGTWSDGSEPVLLFHFADEELPRQWEAPTYSCDITTGLSDQDLR